MIREEVDELTLREGEESMLRLSMGSRCNEQAFSTEFLQCVIVCFVFYRLVCDILDVDSTHQPELLLQFLTFSHHAHSTHVRHTALETAIHSTPHKTTQYHTAHIHHNSSADITHHSAHITQHAHITSQRIAPHHTHNQSEFCPSALNECDIFHLCTSVICYSVNIARAYTSARPLSLKANRCFYICHHIGFHRSAHCALIPQMASKKRVLLSSTRILLNLTSRLSNPSSCPGTYCSEWAFEAVSTKARFRHACPGMGHRLSQ